MYVLLEHITSYLCVAVIALHSEPTMEEHRVHTVIIAFLAVYAYQGTCEVPPVFRLYSATLPEEKEKRQTSQAVKEKIIR